MLKVGDKFKFESEKQRYTVQAVNDRFAIMTKPLNVLKTYLYTITDRKRGVRGPCNLIFGVPYWMDLSTREGAAEALAWIERGEMEVSFRKCVDLTAGETFALMGTRQEYVEPL